MSQSTTEPVIDLLDYAAIERAQELATRDALLEHARMGRSVCEGRDGKVIWITPAEIFARYGFDEFGRPVASTSQPDRDVLRLQVRLQPLVAQLAAQARSPSCRRTGTAASPAPGR